MNPGNHALSGDSLNAFADSKLASLRRRNLLRETVETERGTNAFVARSQTRLLSFACNDYLGLSQHPEVIAASISATQRLGVGAGASRLISGSHPEYAPLESLLARLKGTEDAVVFGSGYLANIGIVTAIAGARDFICVDEYAHSCLLSGAALSRATVRVFGHNDVVALSATLQKERSRFRHCLVLTEGVFSMDGDRAPLAALAAVCERFDSWLLCDDAHGLGVIGAGRGSGFAEPGASAHIPLQPSARTAATSVQAAASASYCVTVRAASYIRRACRPGPSQQPAKPSKSSTRIPSSRLCRWNERVNSPQRSDCRLLNPQSCRSSLARASARSQSAKAWRRPVTSSRQSDRQRCRKARRG
jgi:hypothetical protein